MKRRPTLDDVARLAGVDRAVVSKLLSNDRSLRIRPETRERVLEAIETLGYRRNAMARALRTATAGAFGLVIPAFSNPVYAQVIAGASVGASDVGASLVTTSFDILLDTNQSQIDLLRDGRVDGMLLAGSIGSLSQRELTSFGPCLSVNRRFEGFDRWVILDDEGAVRIAVAHLVELKHRDIAHIGGPNLVDTAERRAAGFRSAMAELVGIEPSEARIYPAPYTSEGGYGAMRIVLESASPPTAVVVANLTAAIGVLRAAGDAGVEVPDEMSIVALHDLPLADFLRPGLTTVSLPLMELGRKAVQHLAESGHDVAINEVIDAPIQLVKRESTAPIRRKAKPKLSSVRSATRSQEEDL